MKQYNALQLNEMIQPLIKFMETEYPNNYELVIDGFSAHIRNKQTEMTFLNKIFGEAQRTKEPLSEGDKTKQANSKKRKMTSGGFIH